MCRPAQDDFDHEAPASRARGTSRPAGSGAECGVDATTTENEGMNTLASRARPNRAMRALVAASLVASATAVLAMTVGYGRITAVRPTTVDNRTAQVGGTLVGGALGVASGSGRSSSNRALRGAGGAFAGNRIAGAMSGSQAFEYTVLIGGQTTTIVTEQAGLRVGDCVSIERGNFNNIRLAADARCNPPPRPANNAKAAPAPTPAAAVQEANACDQAKEQVLAANTDEEFDRAERRMRLLCN